MKIKVDKEEYAELLERVTALENKKIEDQEHIFENWRWTRDSLYKMMEEYFEHKCITTIVKRDKDKIIGEVREMVMGNLFKGTRDGVCPNGGCATMGHDEFDRMSQCRACGRLFMRVNRDDICEECAKIKV